MIEIEEKEVLIVYKSTKIPFVFFRFQKYLYKKKQQIHQCVDCTPTATVEASTPIQSLISN